MSESPARQRAHLQAIARQAMLDRGLEPDFPAPALAELARIPGPVQPPGPTATARAAGASRAPGASHGATAPSGATGTSGAAASPAAAAPSAAAAPPVRDLRSLLWCSIDNDDSRDLDQLSVAEATGGAVKVLVAIADVDALVAKGSAIDGHARANTTSVYTAAEIFPMLPTRLSTDLTSLGEGEDRLALVVELVVEKDGSVSRSDLYRAWVRNQAKLAYNGVGAWLEGKGPPPQRLAAVPGMDAQLRLQDGAAQQLRSLRQQRGALELQTLQSRPVFDDDRLTGLVVEVDNRAKQLIEDFMIAANGVTAQFLAGRGLPSLRRVVRTPKRWDRIVELAATHGERLPADPDSAALSTFLDRQRRQDPLRFPDLSLAVVKLLGSGEYVAEAPGGQAPGHFGLAVRDYTHSTAPNRRYPDVITQRLLKAALAGRPTPYSFDDLSALGMHCTEKEDDAQKVERRVHKSAAAMLLASRIGQSFDGLVTGASDKGTWVRIFEPPAEGRLDRGAEGLDVGDRVRVRLTVADVDRGFIDFVR
jgi:VacB/RNase II family 3'-5' exoribonuclease